MSAKSTRESQQGADASMSGDVGEGPTDFGSNSANQEAMASGSGPLQAPVYETQPSGDDLIVKLGVGSRHGVSVGNKVKIGVNKGAVQKVYSPGRCKVLMFGHVGAAPGRGDKATVHRGTSYSREKYEKEQEDRAKRRGEQDAERDREDEYRTRR